MKKKICFFMVKTLIILLSYSTAYAFSSGSTGALGAFSPTTNTEVTLPADGILNYTTVNIPTGVTVTFKKNAANTPVYILATGNVTIAGTIKLDGAAGNTIQPGVGGPGGFDGGFGGIIQLPGSKGIGPGGGNTCTVAYNQSGCGAGGGGFGSAGTYNVGGGGGTYGNERIIPMIGGSGGGGGGGASSTGGSGGGGGGAILIASSGTITVNGIITANGANGVSSSSSGGGGGSAGAIKLMATTIAGDGTISAIGGYRGSGIYISGMGGNGRIRLEANIMSRTSGTTPVYTFSYPGPVFVANMPSLKITSIGGVSAPIDATGSYATPDITLPSATTNPVSVAVSAENIPVGTTVTVSVIPQFGSPTNVSTTLSGTDTSSTASANINLSTAYANVITAQATFTITTAMFYDGEKIEKVRVAAIMGGKSEAIYITEKGKEIKSDELMARLMR